MDRHRLAVALCLAATVFVVALAAGLALSLNP